MKSELTSLKLVRGSKPARLLAQVLAGGLLLSAAVLF